MNENSNKDGWYEWSRNIVTLIERLGEKLDTLREDLNRTNLDMSKLGLLSHNLAEVEKRLSELRAGLLNHEASLKEAVSSLENDDISNQKTVDKDIEELTKRVSALETFAIRMKTVAYVLGSILAAIIGMMSLDLREVLKNMFK
jgi:light-regulated signal transduction histidine kinase (bacteriophytochrome)